VLITTAHYILRNICKRVARQKEQLQMPHAHKASRQLRYSVFL
jgi:hypothetical protein